MPVHHLRKRLTSALLFFASLALASPAFARQATDVLTSAQARADFDMLRSALAEAHGGLYRFTPKAELDARFDELRERLSVPVTRQAFIGIMSEMIALVGDGHARLEYDSATTAALAVARLLPLQVQLEGERLVVVSNDTPAESTIRPGMELLSVNGHVASLLVRRMLPMLPRDGFIETGRRVRLGRTFAQSYWLFVDQRQDFVVTARDGAGRPVTATLKGVLATERLSNANPVNAAMRAAVARLDGPRENVSLRWVQDPGIAVLRVRAFGGEGYPAALDSVFRIIRSKGARSVILDLRGNGGGVDLYGAQLVGEFVDRPFRYFDRIHLASIKPSFATWKPSTFDDVRDGTTADPAGGFLVTAKLHGGVAEQAPAPTPFLGRLIVLLDGGTFSTAADVVAQLRSQGRATFVGEESGGTYEGNTSGLNALVVLPASGLKLKIMMYQYWNAVAPAPGGRGTLPDHPVPWRVQDVLRGVDAAFERAKEQSAGKGW